MSVSVVKSEVVDGWSILNRKEQIAITGIFGWTWTVCMNYLSDGRVYRSETCTAEDPDGNAVWIEEVFLL
jgi:hypothetical protein